ncbi:MAG TPA: hypothetical protein VK281_21285 [Xanthobacteraceae bacterium]|nr:hypothetical protein [Xanthobacteraceae bacterium]
MPIFSELDRGVPCNDRVYRRHAAQRIDEAVRHRPEWVGGRIAALLWIMADAGAISRTYSRERAFVASYAITSQDPDVVNQGFTLFHKETYLRRRHVASLRDRIASRELPAADLNRIRAALPDEIAFLNRRNSDKGRRHPSFSISSRSAPTMQ